MFFMCVGIQHFSTILIRLIWEKSGLCYINILNHGKDVHLEEGKRSRATFDCCRELERNNPVAREKSKI